MKSMFVAAFVGMASAMSIDFTHAERSLGNATTICGTLNKLLPGMVSYEGSAVYTQEQTGMPEAGYWSLQESELFPACRITPKCSLDVAVAVKTLVVSNVQFAVRGGGHTDWPGAANINGNGITIDLSQLNEVTVWNNNNTVSVGGGARWIDVYDVLVPQGLAVCGGRVSPVGVGGLTTGGGKCFFASKTGFAADGVANFELVTSTGLILQVNSVLFPNLFKALKGGNNNFGIVTRFDFNTFEQGNLWGGQNIFLPTSAEAQYSALYNFTATVGNQINPAGDAQVICAYIVGYQGSFFADYLTYTLPQPNPPQFEQFQAIEPILESTNRVANLTSFTDELATGTPNGERYLFGTMTFENNEPFMNQLKNMTDATFTPLIPSDPGFQVSMVLQPLTKAMTSPGCGKNSLGLCPSDGNMIILDLTLQWTLASNDAAFNQAATSFVNQAVAAATAQGILNEYIYLNYALKSQDPISSYGQSNQANMRAQSKLFDPSQAFQNLVPGGYKLYR